MFRRNVRVIEIFDLYYSNNVCVCLYIYIYTHIYILKTNFITFSAHCCSGQDLGGGEQGT